MTKPMSEERLAELEALAERVEVDAYLVIAELIAEVRRLRALNRDMQLVTAWRTDEIRRLQTELKARDESNAQEWERR